MTNVKRVTMLALFTALALVIHTIEALIPLPVPIPGFKLGLANVITLFLLFSQRPSFKTADVFIVLLCRILLGALISGRVIMLIYSLAGGLLSLITQLVIRRFVSAQQLWVCGAVGAVFHNIGQIIAAIAVTGTPSIALYLPVLIITGIITGTMTGLIVQLTLNRISTNQ